MEFRHFGVGKEGVRPPDLCQHLVGDAELFLRVREPQARIHPRLAEVEVQRKVLGGKRKRKYIYIIHVGMGTR